MFEMINTARVGALSTVAELRATEEELYPALEELHERRAEVAALKAEAAATAAAFADADGPGGLAAWLLRMQIA